MVLHARNEQRAQDTRNVISGAEEVLIGDLSELRATIQLANQVSDLGQFDAIIQNAGVYDAPANVITSVNLLAPYVLSALVNRPKRLVFLSSGMHRGGQLDFDGLKTGNISYSDSKLYINVLTMALARLWPDMLVNAVDPGWVPTKMGGKNASDDLQKGYETQTWLAVSDDRGALVSGGYWYHQQRQKSKVDALDEDLQNQFLRICEELTEVKLPHT